MVLKFLREQQKLTSAIERTGPTQDRISTVASNSNLACIGYRIGLEPLINPAKGAMGISKGTMADTVEAIIGAVYLDGDVTEAMKVMSTLGLL